MVIITGIIFNIYTQKYTLRKLNYQRILSSKTVEIGEEFEITTVVENKKVLPISYLQIAERLPLALEYKLKADVILSPVYQTHRITMLLMPFQRIKRTYRVFGKQRGMQRFKGVTLTAGDFLGFTTFSEDIDDCQQEIIILPKSISLGEELQPYGDYHGEISIKRWIIEDPLMITGIREYTGSDPEKNIHWPSTLKSGDLMVKKYDFTSDHSAVIVLNNECTKHPWENIDAEKVERCYSIARSIMEAFEQMGIPFALSSNVGAIKHFLGKNISPSGYGNHHLSVMLEALGRADYSNNREFGALILDLIQQHHNYATYVIITPIVLDSSIKQINTLSRNVGKVILIAINQENMDKINNNVIKLVGKIN